MKKQRETALPPALGNGGDQSFKAIVEGDTNKAIEFLRMMHGERPVHLVAISFNGPVETKTFDVHDAPGLYVWIEGRQNISNIYFHVNELDQGKRDIKARKQDIVAAHFLHVDIDHIDALEQIRAFTPKATAIVFSGGGYQVYWRLSMPLSDLLAVENMNKALSQRFGGDNCHNIDRLMRVPGTVNVLNKKKLSIGRVPALSYFLNEESDWSRTFSLSDFRVANAGGAGAVIRQTEICEPIEIESLSVRISEATQTLIIDGDNARSPIGTKGARYPSRSEVVYRVTCDLVRAGGSDDEIIGILINSDYKISESVREKPKPTAYARRQVLSAREAVNDDWPDRLSRGRISPTFRNTKLAIRRLGLHAEFDTFHNRKILGGHALQSYSGELTDDGCASLRNLILHEFGFDPGKEHTRDAANALCIENPVHPIREYLELLEWDGKPRIDAWLISYMGADDTLLNREIGRIFFVAGVRRIRKPGTKFDTMLVLEGGQGKGKSTALALLVGEENFSDQEILTLDARAQAEALEGKWIYEIAELDGLSRADTSKVKAFSSRSIDRARPAYGHYREDRPRQTIFVGTTNDDKYLRDMTGNRRFWPVKTGEVDLDGLTKDRDQLWAEAAYREANGESIVLPEELWGDAQVAQEERLELDPWHDLLIDVKGEEVGDFERISSERLLTVSLSITADRQQNFHTKKLAQVMRRLGWSGPKQMKMKDGANHRGYERNIAPPGE